MLSYRHLITVISLIIAVISAWLYYSLQEKNNDFINEENNIQQPTTVIKNFEITELDKTGRIKHHIQSKNMEQYGNNYMQLLSPNLHLYSQDKISSFHVSANMGHIREAQDKIELQGAVRIIRQESTNKSAMHIDTRQLNIWLNKKYASTQERIHYHDNQLEIHALGMKIDFNTEVLNLQANVQSIYQPNLIKDE